MCNAHGNHFNLPWLIMLFRESFRTAVGQILHAVDTFDAVPGMQSMGAPSVSRYHDLIPLTHPSSFPTPEALLASSDSSVLLQIVGKSSP